MSTAGQEMVGPIGAMLGASGVIATQMRHADGRYTGEVEFYAYGEGKALRIRQLAVERGYDLADCYAYSDSFTDLPMLEVVGHPHAVNPDRLLRRAAMSRGWPVLAFARRAGGPGQSGRPLGHVNSRFDKDHESITVRSSQGEGSVVEMSHGPMVLTRQPGTHARPAAGGGRGRSTQQDRAPQRAAAGWPARQ